MALCVALGRRILKTSIESLPGEGGSDMTFGFHISYWTVFGELAPYLAIPAAIMLVLLLGTFIPRQSSRRAVRYLLLGLLVLFVGFAFLIPLGQAGAGWTYAAGQIRVNTGYGSVVFAAKRVTARWVTHNPGYQLALRTDGTGAAHLQAGRFTLKNGVPANVFEYQSATGRYPVLALSSHRTLVLVSSPGVERLMGALHSAPQGVAAPPLSSRRASEAIALWTAGLVGILGVGAQSAMAVHFRPRLPADMAVHFGVSGNPDRTAPTSRALYMGPAIALALGVVGLVVAWGAPANWTGVLFIVPVQGFMLLAMYWMYRMNLRSAAS